MRIRFITLYYPPEVGAAQRRLSELARRLAGLGHSVTVLTGFPNYPSGIKPEGYRKKFIMKEQIDGCRIIRVPHYTAPNKGFLKRLLIHFTFAFSASVYSLFMNRDDIIYVESPPLFNGFAGVLTKWLRRIPYLFNLADLWPQTAVELGILTNKTVIRAAEILENFFYSQASRILAITRGLQIALLGRGYAEDKVPLLTNGVDHEEFREDVAPDVKLLKYKPPKGMLVIYAGTHGLIYSLETLLRAAKEVEQDGIVFVFVGDGADKERLLSVAQELALSNVIFLPPRPQADMPQVFRAADLAVISLRDLPISKAIMPVKCFEIMASGVPIIYAARGEMAEHITHSGGGEVIEPEDPSALAEALRRYKELGPDGRAAVGHKGRVFVEQHYTREKLTRHLESIMQDVISHG